jgi:hypothetical protein
MQEYKYNSDTSRSISIHYVKATRLVGLALLFVAVTLAATDHNSRNIVGDDNQDTKIIVVSFKTAWLSMPTSAVSRGTMDRLKGNALPRQEEK